MAELPFLPLATDAYLADCEHLEDAEHGRYLLLLIALWRAPRQRLPNDDEWLARKFRRPVDRVKSELRPLIAEFCNCDGNWITQKRLSKEFRRASKSVDQRREAAKARWEKRKQESGRNANTPYGRNAPTPTPTPTPTIEEKTHSQGRAQPLPDGWQPSEAILAEARKARPDIVPARLKLEVRGFISRQREDNGHSHNWDESCLRWLLKTKITTNPEPSPHGTQRAHDGEQPRRRTRAENAAAFAAAFRRPDDSGPADG